MAQQQPIIKNISWMTFVNQHMGDIPLNGERQMVIDPEKERLKQEAIAFMRDDISSQMQVVSVSSGEESDRSFARLSETNPSSDLKQKIISEAVSSSRSGVMIRFKSVFYRLASCVLKIIIT